MFRVGMGSLSVALAVAAAGCASEPCTVSEEGVITCPDGTTADLRGADGAPGAPGADGADGTDGADGADGADGGALVTCAGSGFIDDQVFALAGCQRLMDSAFISVSTAEQLAALADLQEVAYLTLRTQLTEVELPALRNAYGLEVGYSGAGVSSVGGSLPTEPTAVSLPALQTVDDQLRVIMPSSTVSLPALTSAGSISAIGAVTATLPELRYAYDLQLIQIVDEQFVSLEIADGARLGFVNIDVEGQTGCFFTSLPAIAAVCEDDNCRIGADSNEGSACDNCAALVNDDQADLDDDGVGDVCDDDTDGDTVANDDDVAPQDSFACTDSDGDGCDDCTFGSANTQNDGPDDDGDGICNGGPPSDCQIFPTADGSRSNLVCFNGRNFADARAMCQSMGLDLPVFHSAEERSAYEAGNFNNNPIAYWVGVTDAETENTFIWLDGTTMSAAERLTFNFNEPDNAFGDEDCVITSPGSGLSDFPCSSGITSVCVIEDELDVPTDNCRNVSNADQRDTDGDGQGDACDPCVDNPLNTCQG